MANRVTSNVVEVLSGGGSANARVTSNVVEVLHSGATAKIRVTSNAIEVLSAIQQNTSSPWKSYGGHKLAAVEEEVWKTPAPRLFTPPVPVSSYVPFTRFRMPVFEDYDEGFHLPYRRRFTPVTIPTPFVRFRMPEFEDPDQSYRIRPRRIFAPIIQTDDGYTFIIF